MKQVELQNRISNNCKKDKDDEIGLANSVPQMVGYTCKDPLSVSEVVQDKLNTKVMNTDDKQSFEKEMVSAQTTTSLPEERYIENLYLLLMPMGFGEYLNFDGFSRNKPIWLS